MTNEGPASKAEWIRGALERYERPLLRHALTITRDVERARDVVQDTFLKLCAQDPAALDGHLAEWLFTVCRHRALDILRKEKRMSPLPEALLDDQSGPEPPPDQQLVELETASHVLQLVSRLPRRQQELVRLKFQNGLSYAEMARITQLSVGNVGFILHGAIRELRRLFREESSAPTATPNPRPYEQA